MLTSSIPSPMPLAIRAIADAPARSGPVVLVMGVLDVGEQLPAVSHEVQPPAHQVSGRPHLGRINVSLGHHPSSEQHRHLPRVDAVVLGLGSMDGPHVECMAEHEGDAFPRAQICDPVPSEDALDSHDQILPIGCGRSQELFRIAANVAVKQHLSFLVENADVHESRMQIDSAVVLVSPRVESHRPLLF
jgi:hypothetical protein